MVMPGRVPPPVPCGRLRGRGRRPGRLSPIAAGARRAPSASSESSALAALRLQHRPGAFLRAAAALPDLLHLRRVALVEDDPVVVRQLLARPDVADRLDQDPVLLRLAAVCLVVDRLAVRLAA